MHTSDQTRSLPGLTPIDPGLLSAPIDYLHAVHLREREACAMLNRVADIGRVSGTDAKSIMSFLSEELPLHLEDEETDLFPLLQVRCSEEDEIDRLLKRLSTDHRHADFDTPRITAILQGTSIFNIPGCSGPVWRYEARMMPGRTGRGRGRAVRFRDLEPAFAACRPLRPDFRTRGHAGHGFRRRSWTRRRML